MNVLCISYEYPPLGGGGAPVCEGVATALAASGHRVDVVTTGMRGLPRRGRRKGVEIHRHGGLRRHAHYSTVSELVTGLWPAMRTALRLAAERPYDLIHCHFIVPSGIVAAWVSRRTGLPYIITAHGSDVPGYNPDRFGLAHQLIRPVWRNVVRNAVTITTPSEFLRASIRSRISAPVEVIPNGYDAPPSPGVQRRNRVLVVTRMFERKGVQFLIEAMQGLDPAWELHVVGDGPYLTTLREEAASTEAKITFHGYVKGAALTELYHSAKIFSLPSISENYPVVLLEAMAAGCAVVTTEGTGCAEVVGEAGVCVSPGDPDALRSALSDLMSNPSRVQELSDRALVRSEQFTWEKIGAQFERLFRRHSRT